MARNKWIGHPPGDRHGSPTKSRSRACVGVANGIVEITGGRQQHCQPHTVGVTFGNKHLQKDSLSIGLNVTPERASLSESAHQHRRRHCRHLSAATKVAGEAARRRRSLRTPAACRPPGRRQGPLVEQQEARRRTPSRHRHERDNAPTPREPASAALHANGSPTQSDRRRGGGATTLRELPEGAPAGAGGQPGSRPRTSRGVTHLS